MTTSINWPEATLGLPTVSGYRIEPQEGVARTDMDAGPARQRRRWTATPTRFPVELRLTRHQLMIFEAWYEEDGAQGAAWFNIRLLSGIGLSLHEARFLGQYRAAPFNASDRANLEIWRVTAVLEVRERPMLTAAELDELIAFGDSDYSELFAVIASLHDAIDTGLWSEEP